MGAIQEPIKIEQRGVTATPTGTMERCTIASLEYCMVGKYDEVPYDCDMLRFKLSNGLYVWLRMSDELVPRIGAQVPVEWLSRRRVRLHWPVGSSTHPLEFGVFDGKEGRFCMVLGG